MLRAGALIYALLLAVLALLVCSSFILVGHYHRIESNKYNQQYEATANAKSGLTILLAGSSNKTYQERTTLDLFDNGEDLVQLSSKPWGAYEVVTSRSSKGRTIHQIAGLVGQVIDNNTALYLVDANRPLALCGNTVLRGNCYLPKAGLKRAYIEGQSFQGNKLVDGLVQRSERRLPAINASLRDRMNHILVGELNTTDSVVNWNDIASGFERSFFSGTVVVESDDPIQIDRGIFRGNLVIRSSASINVHAGAMLDKCLLIAPEIRIHAGYTGSVQAYATRFLQVEEGAKLTYPTALGMVQEAVTMEDQAETGLLIGKGSAVHGIVLVLRGDVGMQQQVLARIDEGATVQGQVYVEGSTQLDGSIIGSLYTTSFLLKTPSSVYENHLLNATIDAEGLSPFYAGVELVRMEGKKKVISWLN